MARDNDARLDEIDSEFEGMPSIYPDQRVVFVGRTGSGKTYLARALLADVKRLFVFDAKGTLAKEEWALTEYDESAVKDYYDVQTEFRVRIPTPIDGDWQPYLWDAYNVRNCTVYIDEVYGVESGTKPTEAMRAVITRGRELGIGVWSATQRPSYIPLIILSEADWIFEFQLRMLDDRKRIASLIGREGLRELKNHQFIAFNDAMNEPIFFNQAKVSKGKAKPAKPSKKRIFSFGNSRRRFEEPVLDRK